MRLPHFLGHYRRLGVAHFVFVDNGSSDGSADLVSAQPDCSLWSTNASYKESRFGIDWINHLLARFGVGHWCLTVDVDEIFTYARSDSVDLNRLTKWLEKSKYRMFGALMLDLYPDSAVGDVPYQVGADPLDALRWFDAGPYRARRQELMRNLWVQGGARERVFFKKTPRLSPTLNKIPLVKWQRSFAYVNSTHSMLPRDLNAAYIDMEGRLMPSGVLLHTKFLNTVVTKSAEEKHRKEHFSNSADFDQYYDALTENPVLWHPESVEYEGPKQLEDLGLILAGDW
ncbi:glycosyltransferase family 2 protein [Litoreibacter arenae]|uniref:glycosyltransferase family 2 protein n=1 Tax=Litoreibacter arenae TaxID=491388 RepID=UPI001FE0DB28|nr:glycosyltransferase family 2 protein [Litoreibacter arenae]